MSGMNSDNTMVVASGSGGDERDGLDPAAPPVNPLVQVHALLRGRYWIAIVLAIVFGVAGGFAGYRLQTPTYTSTGLIRIRPYVPPVLPMSGDMTGAMPFFDQFMGSQVALIKSRRVVDHAMQQPDWRALKRALTSDEIYEFTKSLEAMNPPGSELVLVSFTNVDPDVARRGVKSVVDAYEQLYGENDADSIQSRLQVLEGRQKQFLTQQKETNDKIAAVAVAAPAGAMEREYEAKLQRTLKLKARLDEVELSLGLVGQGGAATRPAYVEKTVDELALTNPRVERLMDESRSLKWRVDGDRKRLGEKHQTVLDGEAQLKRLDDEIEALAAKINRMMEDGIEPASPAKTRDELVTERTLLQKTYEREKAATDELGEKCWQLEKLRDEAASHRAALEETKTLIDRLMTEARVSGRVIIESRGDLPLAPTKDKRKAFAAAGGMGGAGAGVGLVLLFGLFDRRVRHIADVKTAGPSNRVLGVLPMLPTEGSDPEQAMVAAHGVHQIRMLLQGHMQARQNAVIAVTSASPGAGKTSMTMALGLSFAASGARTLMIDCDIIGGGLTSRMKRTSRRRTGHILRRLGLITSAQLVEAVRESRQRGERVGETLVRHGLVTPADVEHALAMQQDSTVGLREALLGDPPNECITGAGTPGLYVMPLGSAQRQHVAQLSFAALQRLVDQVRGWFDVVLIDTGPLLGSLEASVAVMVADEVVLAVARGEQRPLIERSIEHLNAVGGRLAGIVMNRANADDILGSEFGSSSASSSSSSRRASGDPEQPERAIVVPAVDHKYLQLGPIGRAVVASSDTPPAPPRSPSGHNA